MKISLLSSASLASLLLVSGAAAQQTNEYGPTGPASPNAGRALGTNILNNFFDVEGPTGDIRCLGVEAIEVGGALQYIVTGAGTATAGSGMLHMFDSNGLFMASTPQVTNSTVWQGRDMEAISDGAGGYTLYVGSDNAELSEYAIDAAGVITHTALHTVNGLVGTTRALCSSDGGTTFYTKSFTSPFYEFTKSGTGSFDVQSSNAVAAPSAYGFGWDDSCGNIWSTDTNTDLTEIMTDGNATGQVAPYSGIIASAAQGGADVYWDSRNATGSMTAVVLCQATPDHIYLVELNACAPAGPTLTISGSCPGGVTGTASNMTPGGPVAFYYGLSAGSTPVPQCAGLVLPVSSFTRLGNNFVTADASGNASVSGTAQPNHCGVVIIGAADVATCTSTNGVTL